MGSFLVSIWLSKKHVSFSVCEKYHYARDCPDKVVSGQEDAPASLAALWMLAAPQPSVEVIEAV